MNFLSGATTAIALFGAALFNGAATAESGSPAVAAGHSRAALARSVERAAVVAAQEQVTAPDSFVVTSSRFGGSDPIGTADVQLETVEVQGPNASGYVRVTFGLIVDGVPRGQARATVRGRVQGPALLALTTLIGDEVIQTGDLEVKQTDLTRVSAEPLRDPRQAAGRVPVRTIGRGRVLTAALVKPEPLVRRGQTVDLKIETDRMMLRARATALRDGAIGEVVPAENSVTGARLRGRVQADGSLLMVR